MARHTGNGTGAGSGQDDHLVLADDHFVIRELRVGGTAYEALRHGIESGEDPVVILLRILEAGGIFMLHGASQGLLDAVEQRVKRVLDVLDERAAAYARTKAVFARTSRGKGDRYEDVVEPLIHAAFAPFGDVVTNTSRRRGLDGSNDGDFTVEVSRDGAGPPCRVVVEAKDHPTMQCQEALDYLRKAMTNRAAQSGVLAFGTPNPALEGQPFRCFSENRILVLHEPEVGDPLLLNVACQLGRTFSLSATDPALRVNTRVIRSRIDRLAEMMYEADALYEGLDAAHDALDRIEQVYGALRDQALGILNELQERLTAVKGSVAPPRRGGRAAS